MKTFKVDDYYQKALGLWTRSAKFEGTRGNIYDRNGKLIVSNENAPSIVYIPKQINDKNAAATQLSKLLNVEKDKIYQTLNKKLSIDYLKCGGQKLDLETYKSILELDIEGIYLIPDSKRNYLYNDLLASSIGTVGAYNQGLTGLELKYEKYLKGTIGSIDLFTDAHGNLLSDLSSIYYEAKNGADLYLTIDLDIQLTLKRIIENAVKMYNPDDMFMICMDVNTGEILGLEQYPSFEPNNYLRYDEEIINRNLPIFKVYEPGSTGKILTFATGLEEKVFTLDETFIDPGFAVVDGIRIKDWKKGGHGKETYLQVLENSCNPGFVNLGLRIGKETLFKYFKKFGLGEKTGIDLVGEGSGLIFKTENVNNIELATSAFGQGNAVTGIQLVTSASSTINGGYLLRPYIVKTIKYENEIMFTNQPYVRRKVISENTSHIMRYALECVVAHGTGRPGYLSKMRIGGKTGTAQVVKNGVYASGQYILSYIGFAPMDDPSVCVYVAVTNPKNCIQYGGVICGPMVKDAFSFILPYKSLDNRNDEIPFIPRLYIDEETVIVKNYIGMKVSNIKNVLDYSFHIIGNGDYIINQIPSPNDVLVRGGQVILYTN